MTTSLRIAVADDEVDIRDFFCKVLPRQGHEVVVAAENGRQLVEGCDRENPDLIISDIHMPEMDGLAAVQNIYRERIVPVILVSGHNEPEVLDRARLELVSAFLTKPIRMTDLEPAITLAMRRFAEFQSFQF